jgi:hypothetical protein
MPENMVVFNVVFNLEAGVHSAEEKNLMSRTLQKPTSFVACANDDWKYHALEFCTEGFETGSAVEFDVGELVRGKVGKGVGVGRGVASFFF